MERYHSPKEYLDEAKAVTTTAQRLAELAGTEWEFVRAAVAANANCPIPLLVALTPIGNKPLDEPIAVAIARRHDAPADTLRILAHRVGTVKDWASRNIGLGLAYTLLANPATPEDTVALLLDPQRTTPHYRLKVIRTTRRFDVLQRLANDASEKVRDRAIKAIAEF
jgi:hypothetical protein